MSNAKKPVKESASKRENKGKADPADSTARVAFVQQDMTHRKDVDDTGSYKQDNQQRHVGKNPSQVPVGLYNKLPLKRPNFSVCFPYQ